MSEKYDVIVVGLGAIGSASLYQLSKTGARVLGIDQFEPPHLMGSSHGETRITRLAIGEGAAYTPLALRSLKIWKEIENALSIEELYTRTGLIVISSPTTKARVHVDDFMNTTVATAKEFGIEHEIMNTDEIQNRFPMLNVGNGETGYFESAAGFLRPERCIEANLQLAKRYGARLLTNTKVIEYSQREVIEVRTESDSFQGEKLLLCTGPWLKELVTNCSDIFKVYRQVLYWFDISESYETYREGKFPVFIWEPHCTDLGIYGFPAVDGADGGIKISAEIFDQELIDPTEIDRTVSKEEISRMYEECVKPLFKGIGSECIKSSVCLYTMTEDAGFVVDETESNPNIWFASPCSGHGFKHSAALGEAIAQKLLEGKSSIDLSYFSLSRYCR